ncbi:MAG: tyrosine-type recombinase/integrase [Lachnospiraceae bacterium]|nr:tyrosine-type recombinase/integrase [Lachnospiraceae bacterium]
MSVSGAYGCEYLSDEFILAFSSFLASQNHSRTAGEYKGCVRSICNFAKKDFLSLSRMDVDDYFIDLNDRKLKHSTQRSRYYRLVTLARFVDAKFPGLRLTSYLMSLRFESPSNPEESEKIRRSYMPEERFKKLLSAADEADDVMASLIFSLSYRSGLSASEVCGLRVDQLFRDGDGSGFIHLYDDSYHAERNVPLDSELCKSLYDYMDLPKRKRSIFIFLNKYGNPLTLRNLNSMFRKYCIGAGLGHDVSFRDLRSSAIVHMFSGGSAQEVGEKANLRKVRLTQYADAKQGI